jgi:hypothetical protein
MQNQPTQTDLGADGLTVVDKPSYFIVKAGKSTVGYVSGRKTLRVESPRRAGRKSVAVAKAGDVAKAVKFLSSFVLAATPRVGSAKARTATKGNATAKAK